MLTSILAGAGLKLLSQLFTTATEVGKEKIKDFVKEKTGVDLEEIEKKKKLTPEIEQKLRELEMNYAKDMTQLILEDIQSAREMQKAALSQEDTFSKRFVYYFAMMWAAFAMTYLIIILFVDIPENNIRFVDTVLGFILGTVVASIISFFYGSSDGSSTKTHHIKELVDKLMEKGVLRDDKV